MRFALPGGRGDLPAIGENSKLVQAMAADELGYHCLWLSEQHFGAVGRYAPSSAIVLAAAIAACTTRIRIGFSALPIQLHSPVRLAEDIGTLDVLSGGRIDLGIGPATDPAATAFGHDPQAGPALGQALDTVLAQWAGPASVNGVEYQVGPAPAQRPHPPVYLSSASSEQVAFAAGREYALILPAMWSRAALADRMGVFEKHGGVVAACPVERFLLVAETDAAAGELARPLIQQLTTRYAAGTSTEPPGLATGAELDPDRFQDETAIIGGPDTVAGKIATLRDEVGIGYVNLRPSLTGLCPLSIQRTTVSLFAAEVLPRFTDRLIE